MEKEIKTPEPAPEPAPEPSYIESLNIIKADYEKRIEDERKKAKEEIKERDDVIRQLLQGANNSPNSENSYKSVADIVNERRAFTKW